MLCRRTASGNSTSGRPGSAKCTLRAALVQCQMRIQGAIRYSRSAMTVFLVGTVAVAVFRFRFGVRVAGQEAAEAVRQEAEQHGGEGGEDEGVEHRVAGGAEDVGGRQDDAVGKTEPFLFFLDEVAVEPGLEGAVGAVAGEAVFLGFLFVEDLVRE